MAGEPETETGTAVVRGRTPRPRWLFASGPVGRQIDGLPRGARPERGTQDLLHVAAHLRGAEALDRSSVAHAREEIRHAVPLVRGRGGRLHHLGGPGCGDLHT